MSIGRIKALFLQEYFISRGSLDLFFDFILGPTLGLIILGFEYLFFGAKLGEETASYLIIGQILWQVIWISQYVIAYNSNVNMWSRNLTNLYITPLSTMEYIVAQLAPGSVKSLLVFLELSTLAFIFFHFSILDLGLFNLILFFINLTVFGWSMGLIILGIIYKIGSRLQAISWGLIWVFQPFMAVYYPISIMPLILQKIAAFMPTSYVFEASRDALVDQKVNWWGFLTAFWGNLVFLTLAVWFFHFMFEKSRQSGQFARNEG